MSRGYQMNGATYSFEEMLRENIGAKGGGFLSIQEGKITYLHNNPKFAKITVTGTQNQVYVSPKFVNQYNLRVGNLVEFKSKAYDKGPSVTKFTKVRGESISQLNTRKPSQKRKNNSKSKKKGILGRTISKIKDRYKGPQGFLRRLFLVAMGAGMFVAPRVRAMMDA